jgi:methylated-DNA-[protein]-cysteine S-methyltransferase
VTPAAFALVDAPWGPIHVAATDRGIAALELLSPTEGFLEGLRRRGLEPEATRTGPQGDRHRHLDRLTASLASYLSGVPNPFGEQPLDVGNRPDWDRTVLLDGVRSIGWGEVASYGGIARRIGRPGAARAVGGAVGRNPIGILIPCHRVIAGDGSIGGYGGAWYGTREALLDIKRQLLALEGISLPARHLV